MESSLAAGFQTPIVEIVAVAVVIIGVVAGFGLYAFRKNRIERLERHIANAARYRELVQIHALTPTDEHTIQILARHLRDPSQKHLLLQSQGLFNQSATLALEDEAVGAGQISALRVKLGYSGRLIGLQPRSSVDIPAGSGVLVERAESARRSARVQRSASARHSARRQRSAARSSVPVPATVVGSESGTFRISVGDDAPTFPTASSVHVVYQNDAGVFEFDTVVLQRDNTVIDLQHVESIQALQQRRHYRKAITLPVYVSDATVAEEATATVFIDIGGGGASFRNPDKLFRRGDTVELSFHPDEHDELNLTATVVRTSEEGAVAHVRYGQIRESSRDRVYRLLFDPRRPPRREIGTSRNSDATAAAKTMYNTRKNQSGKS